MHISGRFNQPGSKTANTTVTATQPTAGQVAPPPDEFEAYNVTQDPTEQRNLVNSPLHAATVATLSKLLYEQRKLKLLSPTKEPWADGAFVQFPPENNPTQLP